MNTLQLEAGSCFPSPRYTNRLRVKQTWFDSEKEDTEGFIRPLRFDKTQLSGRYEQAGIREERNTGGVYPVASIYE
jgi:hypothetical protein